MNADGFNSIDWYCRGISAFDLNQWETATQSLKESLKGLHPLRQRVQVLAAHYALGRIYEDSGESASALEHYSEVLALDNGYKDTKRRAAGLEE